MTVNLQNHPIIYKSSYIKLTFQQLLVEVVCVCVCETLGVIGLPLK